MDLQIMLNLIAYALIILGVLLTGVRLAAAEISGCRYALTFGWLCIIGGLILNIVVLSAFFESQNILQEIAYSVILGGVLLSFPAFSCQGDYCHRSMIQTGCMAWLSFVAGLVLLVVSVYLSMHLQNLLSTIADALFIFGLLLVMLRAFKSVCGAFIWVILLAGFILSILAIYR